MSQITCTEYLTRPEASKYLMEQYRLSYSPGYLARLACIGGGPARLRHGKNVVYRKQDLEAWVQAGFRVVEDAQ
jgi:hypothetical protein